MTHSQRKLFPIDGKEIEPLIAAVAAQEFDVKIWLPNCINCTNASGNPFEKSQHPKCGHPSRSGIVQP